jgi:hypothetical protein
MQNNHPDNNIMKDVTNRRIQNSLSPILPDYEIISDQMAEILRQKTDAQRLRSVDAFWNSARAILKAAIRTEHPDWSLDQVHIEVARRISNGALDHVLT